MKIWTLAAVALIGSVAPLFAQPASTSVPGPYLSIQGGGKAEFAPEFARFVANVVTTGKNLDGLAQEHGRRATRAASALRDLANTGVKIERSNFSLNQQPQSRPLPTGSQLPEPAYRAVTTFWLKATDLGHLNDTISAIARIGLFEIQSVNFGIEDEERALDLARRDAVADAQRQARIFASAAGVELGDILAIADGSASRFGGEVPMQMRSAANVQISPPGTIPFHAHINITWRIKTRP